MTVTADSTEKTTLEASTTALSERFDLALLDLDGVVYIGPKAVVGAAEALAAARAAGMSLRFVTNNASRPAQVIADHLTKLGVPATASEVVTSAQVAASLLARRFPAGSKVLVVGSAGLRQVLAENGLVAVDRMEDEPVAVVQGFDREIGWRTLAMASHAVREGVYWMATNLDLTFPTPLGAAPGNGSLVRAVATAAGREPDDVAGKPRPGAFLEAARLAGSTRALVVGDRLDTDIEGASAAGMPSLLVLTGVTDVTVLLGAAPHLRPTFVGRDLHSLGETHPAADVRRTSSGWVGRCRSAEVEVLMPPRSEVRVVADGGDALDLLRAAAVAVWAATDDGPGPVGALDGLLSALTVLEPEAAWAR